MSTPRHAVISAAGIGSRLELDMPKCLVEVAGRRIIDYQLDLLQDFEDIRIVVGFMEWRVIEHVREARPDALFVRNPWYRTTSNAVSLHLGTHDLTEGFVSLDGDVLMREDAFQHFLGRCEPGESLVGVTPAKTQEAIFACLDDESRVTAFQTYPRTEYEWSGIAYFDGIHVPRDESGFVYRVLEKHLPLKAVSVECYEVDTPDDLELARSVFAGRQHHNRGSDLLLGSHEHGPEQ